ncbi:TPA: RNA-directed DNA polymerase [Enterobacter cloacae]|uniref:retron St85 family RNA-directed DNA polymerase n=1 Tax=Enterobacter cloacae TaxID=550 RepID=UPI0006685DC2|nr:retron St85 family RNA-directed DNA polymerase [Enterobacter cloacae]HAS1006199.1 RNA-directed DNA polymerase [Enterobacter cloacae]HAS1146476.1 RNA-directed DNA polymerase [Enterobacter cloacae]HAS1181142.1 RNA-directed DNA polymerase [Enterobacter cloacae]HAS1199249.1 RNA-directed DNA polymerase [Enterobacter cloacae]HDW0667782.1 retron St85 family RNA-directed DNA polymerase [Enterobacter cloacae]
MKSADYLNTFRLRHLGLPVMSNLNDMSKATRLSSETLRLLIYRADFRYRIYSIEKKGPVKKMRTIYQPSRELKALQGWVLRNILDKLSSSPFSIGFEKNQSILNNATPHMGANFILNIDLEDFFPSLTADKVFGVFHSLGYNRLVSSYLTKICCYRNLLPQGAPSSPKLANLICSKLDYRIQGYAGSRGLIYTRYADDLTLSAQSMKKVVKAKDFLISIIPTEGLKVNSLKTCISGPRSQKKVTGMVISQEKVGIGRLKYKEIRAKIHHIFTGRSMEVEHVKGWLSYISSVDSKSHKRLTAYIGKLERKYKINPLNK